MVSFDRRLYVERGMLDLLRTQIKSFLRLDEQFVPGTESTLFNVETYEK